MSKATRPRRSLRPCKPPPVTKIWSKSVVCIIIIYKYYCAMDQNYVWSRILAVYHLDGQKWRFCSGSFSRTCQTQPDYRPEMWRTCQRYGKPARQNYLVVRGTWQKSRMITIATFGRLNDFFLNTVFSSYNARKAKTFKYLFRKGCHHFITYIQFVLLNFRLYFGRIWQFDRRKCAKRPTLAIFS